ncbi:MAG TPA: tRNA pseudouridine(55) synthase TruB [Clostridia bacterium]|nr:tRNA pseudouridine(55) synthase TruB [Clostridia bacterium]
MHLGNEFNGIVNVLKPPGMTSRGVVDKARRLFEIKRVGHAGTLDKGAAGVLLICLGKATRRFDILVERQKEYVAEITFGICTDTQDSYGKITKRIPHDVSFEGLKDALDDFIGRQYQKAPAYSSLKFEGKPFYELALRGEAVPERNREIWLHELELICQVDEDRYLLRIVCSRGTYIRTLCEDIGNRLGTCAHMSFLLRTSSGDYNICKAYAIPELVALKETGSLNEAITSIEDSTEFLPAVHINDELDYFRLKNGQTVLLNGDIPVEKTLTRVYLRHSFLGIGVIIGGGVKLKIHYLQNVK